MPSPVMLTSDPQRRNSAKKNKFNIGLKQWMAVLPFLVLGLIGTAVFVIYPMIKNILVSFQDYSIMPNATNPWIGFDNYTKIFTDPNNKFLIALRNTFLQC
jgi:multiple sugar transport system permease protein